MRNADLESFEEDKCSQYHYLTDSFVRRVEILLSRNSQTVMFDLYDKSYTMDLEDFNIACKLPQWSNVSEPHKSEFKPNQNNCKQNSPRIVVSWRHPLFRASHGLMLVGGEGV